MKDPGDTVSPSYGRYLRLENLLSAQRPPDFARIRRDDPPARFTRDLAHHDELLFIIVHQVYELWFKLLIHELRQARDLLGRRRPGEPGQPVPEADIPRVVAALQRANEIFRLAVEQWRLIETMNPTSFLEFRELITPGSGFQSAQFRELEVLAGLSEDLRVDFEGIPYEANLSPEEQEHLEMVRREPTLKHVLLAWLGRTPIDRIFPGFAPEFLLAFRRYAEEQVELQDHNPNLAEPQRRAARTRIMAQVEAAESYLLGGDPTRNRAHQAFLFIASYRREPLLRWPSILIDTLIEFEQHFRLFRFRHARMVERMIGSRTGTGGSPGVAYLDHTAARYKIFDDLLEARSFFLAASRVPPLPDAGLLNFRFAAEPEDV